MLAHSVSVPDFPVQTPWHGAQETMATLAGIDINIDFTRLWSDRVGSFIFLLLLRIVKNVCFCFLLFGFFLLALSRVCVLKLLFGSQA